ncbi:hypothetical protein [Sphingomonas sp.]|uniref:hypothetical protein n=1 Tax=Sphingomonas sp. TaxID=28214 RepID=UPI003B3B2197
MENRLLALSAVFGMFLFFGINYLAGVALSLLVADTTRGALVLGLSLPIASLLCFALLWMQVARARPGNHA